MRRAITSATWLAFAAVMYLILTEFLWHWIHLPSAGNIGFTLVFTAFALLHCAASAGWRRTALFFAIAAIVSYLCEEFGVRTGWIYGPYHYSDMLGPKLGHVPLLIPLAWFMMIYPAWVVARALLRGLETGSPVGLISLSAIAALVMTAWDTVMDPGMAAAGNWIWEQPGPYFGVPMQNYAGWLLTTFLVYCGWGLLARRQASAEIQNGFPALPIWVYGFYALAYTTPRRIAALQIVALFAMVMPVLLAFLQISMPRRASVARQ